jgi:intraflagellar transport protein 22
MSAADEPKAADDKVELFILKKQIDAHNEGQDKQYPLVDTTLKVAVIGPKNSGKSLISTFLAGYNIRPMPPPPPETGLKMPVEDKYEPTAGVRILEFMCEVSSLLKIGITQDLTCKVELWDCSGDQQYEGCWPAIMKDLNGCVIVFDPTSRESALDVKLWCQTFCTYGNLTSDQCVIFAHGNLKDKHKPLRVTAGSKEVNIPIVNVNFKVILNTQDEQAEQKLESSKQEFMQFLGLVYSAHPDVAAQHREL